MRIGALVVGVLLGYTSPAQATLADSYDVIDLGPNIRTIEAIDRQGAAYGSALMADGKQHAAKITGTHVTDLGLLSVFTASSVRGAAGRHVVGETWIAGTPTIRAWVYEQGTPSHFLLDTGGAPSGTSVANDTNQYWSVGWALDELTRQRPVYWDNQTRRLYFQPTLPERTGGPPSEGWIDAVNVFGFSAGQSRIGEYFHATLWVNGRIYDLDTTPGKTFSTANDLNDRYFIPGVVGVALWPEGLHGFLWWGWMARLPPLPGDTTSEAAVINNVWDICGGSTFTPPPDGRGVVPPSTHRAVCWKTSHASIMENQQPVDLNTRINAPGWTLLAVRALNDRGMMVVEARLNGANRFARLVPVSLRVAAH